MNDQWTNEACNKHTAGIRRENTNEKDISRITDL